MPDGRAFTVTEIVPVEVLAAHARSAQRVAAKRAPVNAVSGGVGNVNGWQTVARKPKPVYQAKPAAGPAPPSPAELKRLANAAFLRAEADKKTILAALDGMARTIALLDRDLLADLIWRGQQVPGRDGYGSVPTGERVSGAGGDVHLTSVEGAAEGRCFGRVSMVDGSPVGSDPVPWHDPAGLAVAELREALWVCYQQAATIDRTRELLVAIHDSAPKDRDLTTECCAGCGHQIDGKLHRIHGQAYHDGAEYDADGVKVHGDCYTKERRDRAEVSADYVPEAERDVNVSTGVSAGQSVAAT